MAQHFVKTNESGYITTVQDELLSTDVKTDWKEITVPSQLEAQFGNFSSKFRLDENNLLTTELPAVTAEQKVIELTKQLTKVTGDLAVANETIADQKTTIESLKTSIDLANQGIAELSTAVLNEDTTKTENGGQA